MSNWQPDWKTLNAVAAAFLQSTPLAATIESVTPPGSHAATGLQLELGAIVSALGGATPTTGTLIIAVDTLTVPAETTVIAVAGVEIVARCVQVVGSGAATLNVTGAGASLQITSAEIAGSLSVALGTNAAVPFMLDSLASPQILTLDASSPDVVEVTTDSVRVADVMHAPWSQLSLQLTSAIAGVVADQPGADALALAESMLRWVSANGRALLGNRASFPGLDYNDIASMLAAASALLTATQAAASGAIYVPVLSADLYQSQVGGLLSIAQIYDSKISALQSQQGIDHEIAALATTLGNINQQAAGPLVATLQNLAGETAMLETQLTEAALQLSQVADTLKQLQTALTQAINDQFQQELVSTAVETLFTLATLYVGAAAAVLGDPEVVAGKFSAVLKAALDVTKSLIEAAKDPLTSVIAYGLDAAGQTPSDTTSSAARAGGQVLAASVASFGEAANTLWAVVGVAIANAPATIEYSPDFLAKLEAAPDLSGFTTGGVDPVTYWNAVVVQTQAAVQPHLDLPEATAYLAAVKLAATYGGAIGDLQMKLLDLYTQGISTFARLQAVYQAQAQWASLQNALAQQEQQQQAAIGLLQRGYLNVKRALVTAVGNYRAAFRYQWMQDSDIQVDVSMNYLMLAQQAQRSIDSLVKVLSGTPSGPLRPRQDFRGITYTVTRSGAELFSEVDGQGQAQWSIAAGDPALASQLGGNTAIYLDEVTFVLEGAKQSSEVELEIATSGRHESMIGTDAQRFVSQAVSMNNFYVPRTPPSFISSWKFADAAAYMMPTPYTNWTLTVKQGNWHGVTAISMTLSGKYLQNPKSGPSER
ncbi:hypothetical protein [Roseateles depolymerans]|uniref:Uncharacterized protein n=1 Tax=Roseateles depolymerans TaxID=76731 RepID=A0A0U3L0L8_9BURK|nr:hypothetical protein [Roseateles depolymerans]ALV04878.1 hypothetical protein RD2015_375 [Roseateles depolymerans]REG15110.1 hypothetical protein DES44_3616 [Roseateles depolymerans]